MYVQMLDIYQKIILKSDVFDIFDIFKNIAIFFNPVHCDVCIVPSSSSRFRELCVNLPDSTDRTLDSRVLHVHHLSQPVSVGVT